MHDQAHFFHPNRTTHFVEEVTPVHVGSNISADVVREAAVTEPAG